MTELQKFKCHKVVSAKPMTFGEYHEYKKLNTSCLEARVLNDEGFLVIYNENTPDHYESWSPKKQFEEGYNLIPGSKESTGIMKYFEFKHLPPHLQAISQRGKYPVRGHLGDTERGFHELLHRQG